MSASLIEHRVVKTTSETKKYNFQNKYICTEQILNGRIVDQTWQPIVRPKGYEPERMRFQYYPEADIFLDQTADTNSRQWQYPDDKSVVFVDNIVSFADFDKLFCIWLDMDGYIYKINNPYPLSLWQHAGYIGGITNEDFDLNKVKNQLNRLDFVRNIKRIKIPSYNCSGDKDQAVEFSYRLPEEILKEMIDHNIRDLFYVDTIKNFDPFGLKHCLIGD